MGKKDKPSRPKPQPSKQLAKTFAVVNLRGLKEVIRDLPDDARVYASYTGELVVSRGAKEIALIELKGY